MVDCRLADAESERMSKRTKRRKRAKRAKRVNEECQSEKWVDFRGGVSGEWMLRFGRVRFRCAVSVWQ